MNAPLAERNPRLLIVDDNPSIHEDFKKILRPSSPANAALTATIASVFGSRESDVGPQRMGFELDAALQGQAGLALVREAVNAGRPYALAFVDVRMPPGWDGVETIAKLWEVQPDLQVVVCTAYSDYSLDELHRKLGCSDGLLILKKPFDNIEVQQLATALTEKWRVTRQARMKIDDLEARVRERTAELERSLAQLAQARKMEALGRLAGGVAHDYNNILTATLVQLDLLGAHPDMTPEIKSALQELEKMAQRAAGLTRRLLTFSRQQVLQIKLIDINAVIEDLGAMLRRLLGENVVIEFRPSPAPAWVEGDVGLIEQVVTNLCVNARDAMQPDGGRLTLTIASVVLDEAAAAANPEARPGSFIRLTVADTGCGMDAATLHRIFEPFFTTKEVGKGTGLGLATVYGIAKQLHGWTEVRSELRRGSTFQIFLPAAAGTPPLPVRATAPAAVPARECILLVEDEEMVRRVAAIALRKHGYRVLEAADGEIATTLWRKHAADVDLLFTDMVMPSGMTGRELAKRLKLERPALKVVITSGYSVDLTKSGLPDERDFAYLGKPYDIGSLGALMRRCLDGDRAG